MLGGLPPEVWRIVFSHLTTHVPPVSHSELSAEVLWKNCTFPDPHTTRDFWTMPQFMNCAMPCRLWKPEVKPSAEALSAVQVCRAWHDLGLEFLYHTVVLDTKSHFDTLVVILAPPYDRGRFVRRVRIGSSVQILSEDIQPLLDCCPNIEDFESHEICHSRRLISSLACRSSIHHCFFTNQSPPYRGTLFDLSSFINLKTLHIVAVASLEYMTAVIPQLAVLVLKSNSGSAYNYHHVSKWRLPSLRVLVCQWITTFRLHALCKAFAQTIELLEVIQYDPWEAILPTIEMPVLKYLVVDWTPPFRGYTPRFYARRHFRSLPSLITIRIENLDRALRSTNVATVTAEIRREIAMLSPEMRLAPRLQTLYVGVKLEDIAGGGLERCCVTAAAFGWELRGKDGIWKVARGRKLKLADQ